MSTKVPQPNPTAGKSATWPGGEKPSTPRLPGCRAAYDRQQGSKS